MLFLKPRDRVRRDSGECCAECAPYKMDAVLTNDYTNHTSRGIASTATTQCLPSKRATQLEK